MREETKLVKKFDADKDGILNRAERDEARKELKTRNAEGSGRGPRFGNAPNGGPPGNGPGRGNPGGPGGPGRQRGFGPPGFGPGRETEPTRPGPHIDVADVAPQTTPLYDPETLRTIFLTFEDKDWEAEMADFYNTDVEVPATLVVDGKTYPQAGVHFRGMSSFMMVPAGAKRSLNISMDFVKKDQQLNGYKTLNLNNSHEDPSFLHTYLYFHIARQYIPAPQANTVRVVINGESWGVYSNVQQFDKIFLAENFHETGGARWKVPGSPGGRGGLEYLGDDPAAYERIYELKSKKNPAAWNALIRLCRTLNETPPDQLEAALAPQLDLDGALWFLALENVLINSDGYWIRASDYSIYLDEKGKFHILPHDANETFQAAMGPPGGMRMGRRSRGPEGDRPPAGGEFPPGGPGFGPPPGAGPPPDFNPNAGPMGNDPAGGPMGPGGFRGPPGARFNAGANGLELDPLVGLDDTSKPLRSKLLAVPALKARYLQHVKTLAEEWLDWKNLGPVVEQQARLIGPVVETDTRKLTSIGAFRVAVSPQVSDNATERGRLSLRAFAEQRQKYLLNHPEIKALSGKDSPQDSSHDPKSRETSPRTDRSRPMR
jgi:spore coat protein CotH